MPAGLDPGTRQELELRAQGNLSLFINLFLPPALITLAWFEARLVPGECCGSRSKIPQGRGLPPPNLSFTSGESGSLHYIHLLLYLLSKNILPHLLVDMMNF